jgi:hypothetical protein
MSKPFILIDSSMTMHGVRFLMDGGRWDRFKKNPVMLYMHVRGTVIGKWVQLRFENDAWVADPVFDVDDPEAAKIAGKVEREFLNAASIQTAVIEAREINGEIVITDWEPFEASICDAGSNANALQFCTKEGEVIKDTESYIKTLKLSIMSKETKTAAELAEQLKEVFPKSIALSIGLGEDATADAVSQKITAILDENKELKLAAETNKASRVKDLVDAAFAAKKITDSDRDHYMKLGAVDYDSVKAILDKIPAATNLKQFAASGEPKEQTSEEDKAEYEKLFKEGRVLELQASNPDKFKRLFMAYYGKEPEA